MPSHEVSPELQSMLADLQWTIEQAQEAFDRGYEAEGRLILRSRADEILRLAVLTDDVEIRRELVLVYEGLGRV
jgi:hypothetical protein